MSGFAQASQVEQLGIELLWPWLQKTFGGNVEFCLTRESQAKYGDFLIYHKGHWEGIELKVERRHTGNLFFETWSNRSRANPGWLYKTKSQRLYYLFLDVNILYTMNFTGLQVWATQNTLQKYREVQQSTYSQLNDTWGRLVPVDDLRNIAIVKFKRYEYPKDEMNFFVDNIDFPF